MGRTCCESASTGTSEPWLRQWKEPEAEVILRSEST